MELRRSDRPRLVLQKRTRNFLGIGLRIFKVDYFCKLSLMLFLAFRDLWLPKPIYLAAVTGLVASEGRSGHIPLAQLHMTSIIQSFTSEATLLIF